MLLDKRAFALLRTAQAIVTWIESMPTITQIQMQLNVVANAEDCDFIVWKQGEIFIQRSTADPIFWNEIVPKAELFFRKCILPEIFGNKFIKGAVPALQHANVS